MRKKITCQSHLQALHCWITLFTCSWRCWFFNMGTDCPRSGFFLFSSISKSNSYSTFMLQCPLSCLENKLSFVQHVCPRYLSACCGFRNAAVDEQSTWQQTGNFYHQSTVDSWLTYSAKASLDPASFCSFTALPGEVKLPATQCFNFCFHVIFSTSIFHKLSAAAFSIPRMCFYYVGFIT